tara:strand:+ start:231 stop:479 length:249 start_codon:yes stop_codon:yes gene_type:complete
MSDDAITDQSLTILECRVLLEVFLSAPLPASTLHREHKHILKRLKQKALRGAAMETPDETRVRLQQSVAGIEVKEMFHMKQC